MTDLELMELLESEGYEATLENLEILKEGLELGEYEILDETKAVKKYAKAMETEGRLKFINKDGYNISKPKTSKITLGKLAGSYLASYKKGKASLDLHRAKLMANAGRTAGSDLKKRKRVISYKGYK